MKNSKKIFKISIGLIIIGLILFLVGFLSGGKTNLALTQSGVKVISSDNVTVNEELNPFTQIKIDLDFYDQIEIIAADDFKIEANYNVGMTEFTYDIKDDVLHINQNSSLTLSIVNFDFSSTSSQLKVYVPHDIDLELVQIQTQNSKVKLSDLNIADLFIKNDYGKTTLTNLNTNQIDLESSNATIEFNHIQTTNLELKNDYGQNSFDHIKANTIRLKANNAGIKINQLNANELEIINDYGNVQIDEMKVQDLIASLQNGTFNVKNGEVDRTTIENAYGSINLNYKANLSDYSYQILNKYGSTTLKHNQDGQISKIANDGNLIHSTDSNKNITINGTNSTIKVNVLN